MNKKPFRKPGYPGKIIDLNTKLCIMSNVSDSKRVIFRGSSLNELRNFPSAIKLEAGHQIHLVQIGEEPSDWKPMTTVGQGVNEIRVRDETGAFRVIYFAKSSEAVYVLHCFQKKTEKTSKKDLDLATTRYRDLMKELSNERKL